jgi:DNA polymerase V
MSELVIFAIHSTDDASEKIPYFTMSVSAGKPVPVESEVEQHIDLNELLIEHPGATFFAKVTGVSIEKAGIYDGDVLVVDTSEEPSDRRFVVVAVNGELSIKRYRIVDGETFLETHNGQFLPMQIEPYMEYIILGTVTKVIHSL